MLPSLAQLLRVKQALTLLLSYPVGQLYVCKPTLSGESKHLQVSCDSVLGSLSTGSSHMHMP